MQNKFFTLLFLIILTAGSFYFSLCKGSVTFSLHQIFYPPKDADYVQKIIWHLRFPRALGAFVTGGLLALAGVLMQALLRNPLADPYILGVSGGAAITSLIGLILGIGSFWLPCSAWVGSLIIFLIIFTFNFSRLGNTEHILLIGIALSSATTAIISFLLLIFDEKISQSFIFWILGDFSNTHLPLIESFILITGLSIAFFHASILNILLHGDKIAENLGIVTRHYRLLFYLLSALLTAAAVGLAGCVGFVGLIVPHLIRLRFGADHFFLIPGSVLLGGSLLTFADTLSRTLFSPMQLPVGIFMTLIGIPLFIYLLYQHQSHVKSFSY